MVLKCMCGGTVVDGGDGESACDKCGVVYGTAPDSGQAWSEPVRAKKREWWRLYKLNRTVDLPPDRVDRLIEDMCRKCAIPDNARRRAISLHRTTVVHDVHRGWDLGARAAAIVTLACRLEGVPRTTKTICDAAGVKTGQAHHVYGAIVKKLDLRVPPPEPATYVGAIAATCGVPEPAARRAAEILRERAAAVSGKDPTTLAGAALYVACKEHGVSVTQQSLADAANTSAVSLRMRQRDLTDGPE